MKCCFGWVFLIPVACLLCVLFYVHVCAYAFEFKIQCGSALGPGASRLPYYFTPPVTVGALGVWRHNAKKKIAALHTAGDVGGGKKKGTKHTQRHKTRQSTTKILK